MERSNGCSVCGNNVKRRGDSIIDCHGAGCTVRVHQACYGAWKVSKGPWFCNVCESEKRFRKVRCELCPSPDGAFKRTTSGGWAHVVCALYIPEVTFENVSTMEPISLAKVPKKVYNKTCCFCMELNDAKFGACIQCKKPSCRLYFHATCAQIRGLLCEEPGATRSCVVYCGYCYYHHQKLAKQLEKCKTTGPKRRSQTKLIPAFKPPPCIVISDDESDSQTPVSDTVSKQQGSSVVIKEEEPSSDMEDHEIPVEGLPTVNGVTENCSTRPSKRSGIDQDVEIVAVSTIKRPKTPLASSTIGRAPNDISSVASAANSSTSFIKPEPDHTSDQRSDPPETSAHPVRSAVEAQPAVVALMEFFEQLTDQECALFTKYAEQFGRRRMAVCMLQLRKQNHELEKKIEALTAKRDRLLQINANLAMPLGTDGCWRGYWR